MPGLTIYVFVNLRAIHHILHVIHTSTRSNSRVSRILQFFTGFHRHLKPLNAHILLAIGGIWFFRLLAETSPGFRAVPPEILLHRGLALFKTPKYTETCMATRLHFRSLVDAADEKTLIGSTRSALQNGSARKGAVEGAVFCVNMHISHDPSLLNTCFFLTLSHKFCSKS